MKTRLNTLQQREELVSRSRKKASVAGEEKMGDDVTDTVNSQII